MNFSKLIKNNIVLMFLLVLICLLFINTASASSLIINSTNGNNYKNLIDNFNGTDIKFEDVEIDDFSYEFTKKVNITGKNATLKNDGSKNLFVFSGGSNGGSISDLYLSKSYIAITVRDVSGFTLKNLKIEHANREGMSIYRSSNIKLYNNTVQYSTTGNNYGVEIWMETVTNVSIVNNNINHNNRYGLQVGGGNNISVLNNNISNNTHKFGTNAWFNGVNGLIIIGNNITSANGAFVTFPNVRRGSGLSLDGNDKNVLIANNNISNNGLHGITMGDRTNVNITICNNIINNNGKFISLGYGIHVKSQSTTTLCNNTIIGNPIGIYLNGGLNNKIYNNFISNSAVSFLGLSGIITGAISIGNNAANNIIYNNSIIRSNNGIHSLNGRNNTIENNIISNNAEHGINVDGGSVIIVNNNINNNTRDGVYLTSSNNVVLNNTILNNTIGIRVINSNNNTLNNNKIRKNNKTGISVVGSKNSMIGNLIDSNSENGVIIIGNDNLIQSSNILNHTVIGVNVSGDNNIINYNRFYNAFGLYSNGNNNNINLNWWSLNDVNSQVNGTGYILNWYVLKIATNGNITFANKTYILTGKTNVDASHYFETNVNVPNDKNLLPFFNMIYIDNNGVNHTAVVNDVLQYDFTANGKVVSIRSLLDRENLVVTFNFTLNLINTTILISNYSGYIGDNVTFVATLKDTNGNLINNKSVDFFVNGVNVGSANTDSNGEAKFDYLIDLPVGNYIINATFNGNNDYNSSTNNGTLTVNKKPTIIVVVDVSGFNGETVTLTSKLTDSNGKPISNKIVNFYINGIYVGCGKTNKLGIAILIYKISQKPGKYTIKISFAGDKNYTRSENTSILTVNKKPTNTIFNKTFKKDNGIKMVETGLPISLLLMVILILFCGLFSFKRRK